MERSEDRPGGSSRTGDPRGPAATAGRLILGLGNPGTEYRDTRHNVGFRVVEEIARRAGVSLSEGDCRCRVARVPGVLLAEPQTYMNRSGYAAACLREIHGFAGDEILVVYDDVALPFGTLRMRRGGSPGGHRGLESIVESLRTDEVPRLRLGIREGEEPPHGDDLVEFVLAPFPEDAAEEVESLVSRAADACEAWLAEGIESAMNRFNQ